MVFWLINDALLLFVVPSFFFYFFTSLRFDRLFENWSTICLGDTGDPKQINHTQEMRKKNIYFDGETEFFLIFFFLYLIPTQVFLNFCSFLCWKIYNRKSKWTASEITNRFDDVFYCKRHLFIPHFIRREKKTERKKISKLIVVHATHTLDSDNVKNSSTERFSRLQMKQWM